MQVPPPHRRERFLVDGRRTVERDLLSCTDCGLLDLFLVVAGDEDELAGSVNTLVEASDREEITVGAVFADGETVRFTFDIGAQTFNVTLQDNVAGVDLESTTGIADALADALNGLNGLTASATGSVIDVVNNTDGNAVAPDDNDGGARFEFTAAVRDPNGVADATVFGSHFSIDDLDDADFSTDPDAGDDDRIELTITLSGTVVIGETYAMSITPDVGAPSTITVVATSRCSLLSLKSCITACFSAGFIRP